MYIQKNIEFVPRHVIYITILLFRNHKSVHCFETVELHKNILAFPISQVSYLCMQVITLYTISIRYRVLLF